MHLAVMSANAQPTSSCVMFVDNLNVRHEPLNADEIRRVLRTQLQYNTATVCHKNNKSTVQPQIAHSDMHHLVSGINSLILSVSLASHVSTHLLIHLSAHLYYHHHSHHPSLLHSFTPGSNPTFSTNTSHLKFLLPTGLPS